MIDRFAPNTAALDTPSTEGDARELLSEVCMIRPEHDSPAPAIIAASTLGILIFQMIRTALAAPFPVSAENASDKLIFDEPTKMQMIADSKTAAARTATVSFFFLSAPDFARLLICSMHLLSI